MRWRDKMPFRKDKGESDGTDQEFSTGEFGLGDAKTVDPDSLDYLATTEYRVAREKRRIQEQFDKEMGYIPKDRSDYGSGLFVRGLDPVGPKAAIKYLSSVKENFRKAAKVIGEAHEDDRPDMLRQLKDAANIFADAGTWWAGCDGEPAETKRYDAISEGGVNGYQLRNDDIGEWVEESAASMQRIRNAVDRAHMAKGEQDAS